MGPRGFAALALATITAFGAPHPARAGRLAGTVTLREADGRAGDPRDGFVWFTPARGATVTPRTFEIATKDKTFAPRACTVPRGSTVRFPNADPILHNVFSVSGGNRFDLGLYRTGAGKSVAFTEPGIVRVFCNVHHQMAAFVAVLETPYVAALDASGQFVVEGVPEGGGTLSVWHWRAGAPVTRDVSVPAGAVAVSLDARVSGVPAHLNKTGKPYAKASGDDGYR